MRIQYISDFHMDFHPNPTFSLVHLLQETLAHDNPDILVISGDFIGDIIRNKSKFKKHIAQLSKFYKYVLYTTGNHEYYGGTLDNVDKKIREIEKEIDNFYYLQNERKVIDGQGFVGATLWHKGEEDPLFAIKSKNMSDYYYIKDKRFLQKNKDTVSFLWNELEKGDIVFTHHMPHQNCTSEYYKNHSLNLFFVNYDLDYLILDRKPSYWIYGHTHINLPDFKIGETTFCNNSWGYFGREKDEMSRGKRIIL